MMYICNTIPDVQPLPKCVPYPIRNAPIISRSYGKPLQSSNEAGKYIITILPTIYSNKSTNFSAMIYHAYYRYM